MWLEEKHVVEVISLHFSWELYLRIILNIAVIDKQYSFHIFSTAPLLEDQYNPSLNIPT